MTFIAQTHIDALGEALHKTEVAYNKLGQLLSMMDPNDPTTGGIQTRYDHLGIYIQRLHYRMANAQAAYIGEHGDGTLVAFGVLPGGTGKPPVNEPDEPVEP
jgi:YD repeat-containing protein